MVPPQPQQAATPVAQTRLAEPTLGEPIQRVETPNRTGLPDNLKSGIENLSGYSMEDVRVHYNSAKPAQLQAHAYAQGTDIHVAPGQERHLPHEAWHVVQQKQGRVQATRQLRSKVAINDDPGLEKEADVMGRRALRSSPGRLPSPVQQKNIGEAVTQRKVNNLKRLPAGEPFDQIGWTPIETGITKYNAVPEDDAHYASQSRHLNALKARAEQEQQAAAATLQIEIQAVDQQRGNRYQTLDGANQAVDNEDREIARLEQQKQQSLQTDQELEEGYEAFLERPITEARAHREGLVSNQTAAQSQFDLSKQQLAAKKRAYKRVLSYKLFNIDQNISDEITAVHNQMTGGQTAIDAAFTGLQNISEVGVRLPKPASLRLSARVSSKANEVTAETSSKFKKIKLLDELESLLGEWRKMYIDPATDQVKASINGPTADAARVAFENIKSIEQQMFYTRKAIFKELFKNPLQIQGPPGNSEATTSNRASGFQMADASLSLVKGEASSVKSGMKLDGADAEVFGVKEKGKSVLGGGLLPKTEVGVDTSAITSAGADFIARLIKFKDIKDDWKKAKGKMETASFFADKIDAIVNVANDGTTITENAINMAEEGRSKVSGFSKKDAFGKISEMTGDITSGIMALKEGFLTVKYIWEAGRRAGTDGQQSFTFGVKGAISFAKAAEGTMKLAAGVLKSFYNIAPEPLLRAIPILGIAIELANGLLSLYTAVKAHQAKQEVASQLDPYKAGEEITSASLASKLSINAAAVGRLVSTEKRGVMGGREDYLRFNAYTMAKIDDHVTGQNKDNPLTINVDSTPANNVILSKEDVATIREYEYLSKMVEINQKRRTSGIQSVIKSAVGLVGQITTAAGVTALIGTGISAAVTATSFTQAVAKSGQKIVRNNRRSELDTTMGANAAAGIASFANQKAYTDARGEHTDRSAKQKETEYRRHAFYIMDRISALPNPPAINAQPGILDAAQKQEAGMTKMLKATGVDMFLFLNAANFTERFKLLVKAQQSGR